MKRYGMLYKRVSGFDLSKCAYCGEPRECLDHVPAISQLENIDVTVYLKKGGRLLLYPACLQCNGFLGKTDLVSYYDRLDYLSSKYIKKMEHTEVWTESELNEMGRMMRAFIEANMYKTNILVKKLEVIEERRLNELLSLEDGVSDDGIISLPRTG